MNAVLSHAAPQRCEPGIDAAPAAASLPHVLFVPAMGTAVRFYEPFLSRLLGQRRAAAVSTLELPGQGSHPLRARRGDDYGYREVVEQMLPDAVERIARDDPARPIVLVGHSLGGQMSVLACATLPRPVERIVLIAAGTAHWRAWPRPQRLRAAATVHAVAAAAALLPWYPGQRLGFGGDQSRRFMRDWSYNARCGGYRLSGSALSTRELERRLGAAAARVHLVSIAGDGVAPAGAGAELLALLPRAEISRETVNGLGTDSPWRRHFSWARHATDLDAAVAAQLAMAQAAPRAGGASAA